MHVPMFFLKPAARVMGAVLRRPPVTIDQLVMIQEDNVCSMHDIRDAFRIEPVKFSEGLTKFIGKEAQ